MLKLETPIQYLKGVGPKMSQRLKKLNIKSIGDLIFYFPRDWDDLSILSSIKHLRLGDRVNIKAKIVEISNQKTFKRQMNITTAIVEDLLDTSEVSKIKLIWFNQPYLVNTLKPGQEWIFSGRVEWDFKSGQKVISSPSMEKEAKILPIYSETEGITSKYLRKLLSEVLGQINIVEEYLPLKTINEYNLMDYQAAIMLIHFPKSQHDLFAAKQRLAFDELFLISLRSLIAKQEYSNQNAPKMNIYKNELQLLTKSLSFTLTNAQRKSSWEIIQNLNKNIPMNRLLEGDVGSGKTIVAALAALNVMKNAAPASPGAKRGGRGYQVVWMAPTEILANQHYNNISKILGAFNFKICLITGSNKPKSYELQAKKLLDANLIIGTHALIQEKAKYRDIGLVIIDEQHRFGVKQRAALKSKKLIANKLIPHFLSMTATPIPRTLALSLYGDLDISILDEMPKGRKEIITRIVDPTDREKAEQFVRDQVKRGRQVFVICPLIEEKENERVKTNLFDLERKTVVKEYERLSKEIFPEFKIGIIHGKMKSKEKETIMDGFKKGIIDILVATSVIEVGIDIPNASTIMIENADRFGLAQLHQFRGRVGRGEHQSYCLLFTSSLSLETNKRLEAMETCSDGFKLAEKDLEIRGPGQFYGTEQHGIPDLKIASLTDTILVSKCRKAAEQIISDGLSKFPKLQERLKDREFVNHLE